MLDDDMLHIHNGGGISICAHDECPVLSINAQNDTSRNNIPIDFIFRLATFCCTLLLLEK